MFRDLRADEIDVRIAQATEKGVSLLLYKDARCDQTILDETVGPMNWQRAHTRENANCTVSIWDEQKQQWIEKEDTGTESNTEKEKGLASDSFKRACVNWGIGRELYTAPFIWVGADKLKTLKYEGGRWKCKDNFQVSAITIERKTITGLEICNESTRNVCYTMGKCAEPPKDAPKDAPTETPKQPAAHRCMRCGNEITPVRFQSGKVMAVEEIVKNSASAYGQELCYECCKVAARANNG